MPDGKLARGAGSPVTLRTALRPGDVGWIVGTHGTTYGREQGFDETFEAYVAGPLSACVLARSRRERIWIAERDGTRVGCVAIVSASERTAQLRWFLVLPEARGTGIGTRLLDEAVAFASERGYDEVVLWTVSALEAAARLYRAAGFERDGTKPGRCWGVDVVEERYSRRLRTAAEEGKRGDA